MPENTEIHAKLVLDEGAEKATERLKEGFEHLTERVHETQHELMGMAKQALAVAAGFEMTRGIDSIKEFGHEVIGAAVASEEQERSLAGLIAMTDKTGMSFEETQEKAKDLHDNLEGLAIESGNTGDAVSDAFEMIASRSKKSTAEVLALTDKMSTASRVLPGGIGAISAAWRDMETGIVRPKNAIVQLLVQTHTVSGTMKNVAKGISQMMQAGQSEKVFELAEKAIDKMAKTAEKAPFTFKQLTTSLEGVRELAFKSFGEPMLAELGPPLESLKRYLLGHREAIEAMAKSMGEKVGEWLKAAAEDMEHAFEYLRDHATEIENAIVTGAHALKDVVMFIIEHKEALAVAWGAKTAASGVMGLVGSGGGMVGAAATAVGGAAALGAIGLAVGAVTAAGWQFSKLWNELPSKLQEAQAKIDAMYREAAEGQIEDVSRLRDEVIVLNPELIALANNLQALAKSNATSDKLGRALDDKNLDLEDIQAGKGGGAAQFAVQQYVDQFGEAVKRGDRAAAEHMAQFISTHQNIIDAMHKAGVELGETGKFLVGTLENVGQHMIAEEVKGILSKEKKEGAKPAGATLDFRGSQFHIHQDFKDGDPDRVIQVFRKDLAEHAAARVSARTSGAFGF
jgi:hypothetical protein